MQKTNGKSRKARLLIFGGVVGFVIGLLCGSVFLTWQFHINRSVGQPSIQSKQNGQDVLSKLREEVVRARAVYELASGNEKREAGASLAACCAQLAGFLGENKQSIPEIVSLLKEGDELEEMAGVPGGEESVVLYVRLHLFETWAHKDGDSLLQYLQSPEVSMEEKQAAIDWLEGVIENEYPGKE